MVMPHTITVECNENASNRIMDTNMVKTVVHTNKPGSAMFLNHHINNEICQTTSVLYILLKALPRGCMENTARGAC